MNMTYPYPVRSKVTTIVPQKVDPSGWYAETRFGRFLLWIARKLIARSGAYQPSKSETGWVISFKTDKMMDYLHKQINAIWRDAERPTHIFMGPDVYDTLMEEVVSIVTVFDFTIKEPTFRGLKIVLVPWFTGVLIVRV